jgi:hypothetical protein
MPLYEPWPVIAVARGIYLFGYPNRGRTFRMEKDIFAHVMSRVTKVPGGCWLSDWCTDQKGYSQIWYNGTHVRIHRLVYELLVGPIDSALQIDHLCMVKRCCNPEHLETVTAAVNNARARSAVADGLAERAPRTNRTHCNNGHEFKETDTLPCGTKRCMVCYNERRRRRYETDPQMRDKERKRKAAAQAEYRRRKKAA